MYGFRLVALVYVLLSLVVLVTTASCSVWWWAAFLMVDNLLLLLLLFFYCYYCTVQRSIINSFDYLLSLTLKAFYNTSSYANIGFFPHESARWWARWSWEIWESRSLSTLRFFSLSCGAHQNALYTICESWNKFNISIFMSFYRVFIWH